MEKKTLGKLSFLLPVMMALTSCSSLGNMQGTQTGQGQGAHGMIPHVHRTVTPHAVIHKVKTKPHAQAQVIKSTQVAKASPHTDAEVVIVSPVKVGKKVVIEKPMVVEYVPPVSTKAKAKPKPSKPITAMNPIEGDLYIMNVHSINLMPKKYRKMSDKTVVGNINRLDAQNGVFHFVQVARWDGTHVDQTYVNARTAALMSLVGLSMLENGYIETSFGPVIMVLAGNGYIADIPGHKLDLQTRAASGGTAKSLHKSKQKKSPKVKHFINYHTPEFDGNDFYIQGSKHITVKSKHTKQVVKATSSEHRINKVAVKHSVATDDQQTSKALPVPFCQKDDVSNGVAYGSLQPMPPASTVASPDVI